MCSKVKCDKFQSRIVESWLEVEVELPATVVPKAWIVDTKCLMQMLQWVGLCLTDRWEQWRKQQWEGMLEDWTQGCLGHPHTWPDAASGIWRLLLHERYYRILRNTLFQISTGVNITRSDWWNFYLSVLSQRTHTLIFSSLLWKARCTYMCFRHIICPWYNALILHEILYVRKGEENQMFTFEVLWHCTDVFMERHGAEHMCKSWLDDFECRRHFLIHCLFGSMNPFSPF